MTRARRNNAILYVLTMTFAFTTRYGDLDVGLLLKSVIGIFWIIFAVVQLRMNRFQRKRRNWEELKYLLKLYLLPHIVVHLYSVFLIAIGRMPLRYFSTNVTVYIPTALALLAIYLFKEKALIYTIIAMIFSWIVSVSISLFTHGFIIFPYAIIQGYIDPYTTLGGLKYNYLEIHDLVLAIEYLLIYVIFLRIRIDLKRFIILLITVVIMLLGLKRISVLGLAVAIFFNLMLHRMSERRKVKFCKIAGWIAFFLCYLFIYALSSGDRFYDIMKQLNINTMGRVSLFRIVMMYAEFSPSFLGIGRNAVTKMFQEGMISYGSIIAVHSDIIKMYVENGFILFGLWLWYNLLFMTSMYKKRFGNESAYLYFGIIIYMFILYLTDNTESYMICQMISIMLPATHAIYGRPVGIRREAKPVI